MFSFFLNSFLLGVGLAMDAFSVSLANGLHEKTMSRRRMCAVAGVYALFQALMPMTGWALVRTVAERFVWFQGLIPWIGAGLLGWIGVSMLLENGEEDVPVLSPAALLLQGIATSIDALSVGFAIAPYRAGKALGASLIIAAVTFFLCLGALRLGKRFGMYLARRSSVLGGVILLGIAAELLIRAYV